MTPAARLQTNIELQDIIWSAHVPMDRTLNDYFRTHRHIGSKDRREIADRAYSMMRHHARLSWHAEKLGDESWRMKAFLHYILVEENRVKDLIKLCATGGQYAPSNIRPEEEKTFARMLPMLEPLDMPQLVRVECPPEAENYLVRAFGKAFEENMRAMLRPATLDMRVNTLKCTGEQARASLDKDGIKTNRMGNSPIGLRAIDKIALSKCDAYEQGLIDIQEEGSQLIALMTDAKSGEYVMDYCAGAGGKTLALAAMMENKGRLVAMDIDQKRLDKGRKRYKKAGVHNVEVKCLSNEKDKQWLKRQYGKFDCVLVDAPCSSSGTWQRNPDLRWRHYGPTMTELLDLQKNILQDATKLLKKGGRIVYATCSLNSSENIGQVNHFLANNEDFALTEYGKEYYDVMQQRGFFARVLVKNK